MAELKYLRSRITSARCAQPSAGSRLLSLVLHTARPSSVGQLSNCTREIMDNGNGHSWPFKCRQVIWFFYPDPCRKTPYYRVKARLRQKRLFTGSVRTHQPLPAHLSLPESPFMEPLPCKTHYFTRMFSHRFAPARS